MTAAPCFGQPTGGARLSGEATFGVRSVDVGGADSKYREDVNLDDGARVLDLALGYAAPADADGVVDNLSLTADGLGGDPFETLHFDAQKLGRYKLKLDRRRSDYFYRDVILPSELASVAGSTAGDLHHFDFTRVRDTADLVLDLSPRTKLNVGLEHQTRVGTSTTSQGIQRDQFVLDNPLDESSSSLNVGVQHAWDKVTLIVDEQTQDFENASSLVLPEPSSGQNPSDPAELLTFALDQAYDYRRRAHQVRVLVRPTSLMTVQGAARREDLDYDLDAEERSSGTDFAGRPFTADQSATGSGDRAIDLDELTFGYALSERWQLIGSLRNQSLVQRGDLLSAGAQGYSRWAIETTGVDAGVSVAVRPSLVVSTGLSREQRDAAFTSVLPATTLTEDEHTERDGYFAGVEWRHGRLNLTARFDDNAIDDPFALGSPTASRRVKATARYAWSNGIDVSGSYRNSELENEESGWSGETRQTDLRFHYANPRVDASVGYAAIEFGRNIDQLVIGGTRSDLFAIHYAADTRFVDASARWRIADRVILGGASRVYENNGSFPLERDDNRIFLQFGFASGYSARLALRHVDYTEDGFDDYDAKIFELGVGVGW